MERATAGARRSGRGTHTGRAHGQTDQCRVSNRSLDPAGQHHDARTGHVRDATGAARCGSDGQFTLAIIASCAGSVTDAGCGEKAADAETSARASGRTGFDCTCACGGTGSRRIK